MDIVTILCREFKIQPATCQNIVSLIDDGNGESSSCCSYHD